MKRIQAFLLLSLVLCAMESNAQNDTKRHGLFRNIQGFLENRYHRNRADSNFIVRPDHQWTLKLNGRFSRRETEGLGIMDADAAKTLGFDEPTAYKTTYKSKNQATVGVGFTYLGVGLSFSLNPSSPSGQEKDYAANIRYYGNRFGFELGYEASMRMDGTFCIDDRQYDLGRMGFRWGLCSFNGYYVFNQRRFSMPAAFTQSYIQKRSAGSFMLGLSMLYSDMKHDGGYSLPGTDVVLGTMEMSDLCLGIGAGYGYNFVPATGWLVHASCMPNLIVMGKNHYTYDGERHKIKSGFPDFNITTRLAATYSFGRYFAGATFTHNAFKVGDGSDAESASNKGHLHLLVGMRF